MGSFNETEFIIRLKRKEESAFRELVDGWKDKVYPPSLLDSCTVDGRIYCAPVNIHSPEWLWLSNKVYEDIGIPVPQNWNEFVASAPQVEAAGKIPLALGNQPWQSNLAFGAITVGVGGLELWKKVNVEKDMEAAAGPEMAAVFQAAADARKAISQNRELADRQRVIAKLEASDSQDAQGTARWMKRVLP